MKYLNLYYEVEQCHYLLDPVVFFPTSNLLPLIHIDYHRLPYFNFLLNIYV